MDPAEQPRPSDLLILEQSDLQILEAVGGDGVFNPDGTVDMVLMRPCHGRGPYNNIYEAPMLAREAQAHRFRGWSMFDNHDNPVARKARGGMPRSVSELAGVVREDRWDPDFETSEDEKFGFEKGAVIGRCKLTAAMEALVREIPEAIKGSMNTLATNKVLRDRNGARGWVVEGFVDDPEISSFDLVTKAGAGGRVRSVLEALYDGSNATPGSGSEGDSMTQAEILEAVTSASDEDKRAIIESLGLSDLVAEAVTAGVGAALPTALEEHTNTVRESVRDELATGHRLRGLRDDAKAIIESATLPQSFKTRLLTDYGITEGDDDTVSAGRSLSVIEAEKDADGNVTKAVREVLKDRVQADIKDLRDGISEAAPTYPVSRGGGAPSGGGGSAPQFGGEGSVWGEMARRRGLDPSTFGAPKPAATTTATGD